ncbi:MAG TPA: protein translocase subunit SecD [Bryobacteraceae bacterium]|nr:protein translocase subunit SecD [Bryobacteraceae bacterium]
MRFAAWLPNKSGYPCLRAVPPPAAEFLDSLRDYLALFFAGQSLFDYTCARFKGEIVKRNSGIKIIVICFVVLACLYEIFGLPLSKGELMENVKKNIRLGLDLKGGTQLVMEVQLQDAFKAVADGAIDQLKETAKKDGIMIGGVTRNDPGRLEDADKIAIDVQGVPPASSGALRGLIGDQFGDWNMTPRSSTDYRLTMKPASAAKLARDTMTQTVATIERKIDGLGLSETSVQRRGGDASAQLLVQIPGVDDSAHVEQIFQTQAVLEWRAVEDGPFASREDALAKHGGVLPLQTELTPAVPRGGHREWYLLARSAIVRGTDIRDARASERGTGGWETVFVLTQDAAKRFGRYTENNIGNRAAIVVDGQIISAPVIENRISDTGSIMGMENQEAATDLALNLRAGSLPARIAYLAERTVGPSLGADSIRAGIAAGGAGLTAVVTAMLVYYKRAGINATLALILNALILLAAMSSFNATLTLPGIAGVILTIGMAVDSNVLIFERIREELRAGKAVVPAVDTGFHKAFLTIIDTHVTTIVSCACLFLFGTGPVKGFAVTLCIGLIANVFTAVFVSKTIFNWELAGTRDPKALSI